MPNLLRRSSVVRRAGLQLVSLLVALAVLSGGWAGPVHAAVLRAGDVDPWFGEDGAAVFGPGFTALGVAVQPDGVIAAAGTLRSPETGGDAVIVYLDPSGEVLDAVNLDHGGDETMYGMAAADDGSIVLVGGILDDPATGAGRPLVIRVAPDGTPDPEFGDGGYAFPAGLVGPPTQAGIAPDGSVIIGGPALNGTRAGMAEDEWAIVGRLDESGQLDRSFGTDGLVRYRHSAPPGWSNGLIAKTIAFLPDGRILVGLDMAGMLLRLTPDGQFDPTFGGGDGVGGVDAIGNRAGTDSLQITADGSILTVDAMPTIRRWRPDGTLDRTFGQDGTVSLRVGGGWQKRAALDGTGRLYVANDTGPDRTSIQRLLPSGQVDPTFGRDAGTADVVLGWGTTVTGLALDGEGLVVVGTDTEADMSRALVVTRLLTNDIVLTEPDPATGPSFGSSGPAGGYWTVTSAGHVDRFGAASRFGDTIPGAVDLEPTPTGKGYWTLNRSGRLQAFGDATHWGDADAARMAAGETPASLSITPSGRGYWIFTNRGRAIAFGDAPFLGDMSAATLNGPVLGSVATPSGRGYYMVASDGGIFAFGDAAFAGSMGGHKLNAPVHSLVPDADGKGYWLVASDGGIFAFDAPFKGSMGATKLNKPVVGMVRYGDGYLMVGADGGIFNFSSAPFSGSLGDKPPAAPVVAVAALP